MKKIFILFFVIVVGVASCSSVRSSSGKNRNSYNNENLSSDDSITVPLNWNVMKIVNHTAINVEYCVGKKGVAVISGPDDTIDKVMIEEKGSTLDIRMKSNMSRGNLSGVSIKVYLPDLNEVTLYGAGDFKADRISTTALTLNILGSGDIITGVIDAASLKLLLRGSGDVKVDKITCTNIQFLTQGAGDIVVKEIESTVMKANVQGAGDIMVGRLCSARAEALIQGSGDVAYHDLDVTTFQATVQGSGDVIADGSAFSAALTVQGTGSINAKGLECDKVSKSKLGLGDIITGTLRSRN